MVSSDDSCAVNEACDHYGYVDPISTSDGPALIALDQFDTCVLFLTDSQQQAEALEWREDYYPAITMVEGKVTDASPTFSRPEGCEGDVRFIRVESMDFGFLLGQEE